MSFEDVLWCFFRLTEFRGPKHSSNNEVEKPGNIKIIEEFLWGEIPVFDSHGVDELVGKVRKSGCYNLNSIMCYLDFWIVGLFQGSFPGWNFECRT